MSHKSKLRLLSQIIDKGLPNQPHSLMIKAWNKLKAAIKKKSN